MAGSHYDDFECYVPLQNVALNTPEIKRETISGSSSKQQEKKNSPLMQQQWWGHVIAKAPVSQFQGL